MLEVFEVSRFWCCLSLLSVSKVFGGLVVFYGLGLFTCLKLVGSFTISIQFLRIHVLFVVLQVPFVGFLGVPYIFFIYCTFSMLQHLFEFVCLVHR